jgi:hypothetical protein
MPKHTSRRLRDPGIAFAPVGAVAGKQPHAIVLPNDKHPVPIVLYFMDPVRSRGYLLAGSRQAELVRYTHGRKIGAPEHFGESGTKRSAARFH